MSCWTIWCHLRFEHISMQWCLRRGVLLRGRLYVPDASTLRNVGSILLSAGQSSLPVGTPVRLRALSMFFAGRNASHSVRLRFGRASALLSVDVPHACACAYTPPHTHTHPRELSQGADKPIRSGVGNYTLPGATLADSMHQVVEVPCPPGSYCEGGVRFSCPAGTFGASRGLATPTCSGNCAPGFFCPTNSTSAQQVACGSIAVYCPEGSGAPVPALPGEETIGPGPSTRVAVAPCPSGWYCVGGVATRCPAGRFGCADRQSDARCNGPCTAGFFCPLGSSSSQPFACGNSSAAPDAAAWYCPEGSSEPLPVLQGYFSEGSSVDTPHQRSSQTRCPIGSFCVLGVKVLRLLLGP